MTATSAPDRVAPPSQRGVRTPSLVLAVSVGCYLAVWGRLVVLRHTRFGSFDFDMGIFDQAIWLLARGRQFITVRGLDAFGHHASFAFFLLAPISWLGGGPSALNLLQVGAVAVAAVGLQRLGLQLGLPPWVALAPAATLLLHPYVGWFQWELFHPEVVAMAPLVAAWIAASRRRWLLFGVLAAFAVSWKEDVALAVAGMGLVLALRGERKVGGLTIVASLAWLVVVMELLLPAFTPEGSFTTSTFYGHLGGSTGEVVATVVTEPGTVARQLDEAGAGEYTGRLLLSGGLAALLSPLTLLVGLPQVMINLLSQQAFTWDLRYHYGAVPVVAVALAGVEGLSRLGSRPRVQAGAAAATVAVALVTALTWGVGPGSGRYDDGYWRGADPARQATLADAVELVPGDAPVAASYNLVPHLSRRERIFTFPNPWRAQNWGVDGERLPDPAEVRWLVVDRATIGEADVRLLDEVLASGWRVVLDRGGVVAAERTGG